MAENIPKTLIIYAEANGSEPLTKWLQSLRDGRSRKRIEGRDQMKFISRQQRVSVPPISRIYAASDTPTISFQV